MLGGYIQGYLKNRSNFDILKSQGRQNNYSSHNNISDQNQGQFDLNNIDQIIDEQNEEIDDTRPKSEKIIEAIIKRAQMLNNSQDENRSALISIKTTKNYTKLRQNLLMLQNKNKIDYQAVDEINKTFITGTNPLKRSSQQPLPDKLPVVEQKPPFSAVTNSRQIDGQNPFQMSQRQSHIKSNQTSRAEAYSPKSTPLNVQQFRIPDYLMSYELKQKMQEIKQKHNKISEEFLSLFEKRYIIFIEDGADLKEECKCFQPDKNLKSEAQNNSLIFGKYQSVQNNNQQHRLQTADPQQFFSKREKGSVGMSRSEIAYQQFGTFSQKIQSVDGDVKSKQIQKNQVKLKKVQKAWNHQEKQVKIDINKYIAKYDFNVAKKICPAVSGATYHDEFQDEFKKNALMEVLQECSNFLSNGKKLFQSIYTFDRKYIPSLEDIPENCKIVLVSENKPKVVKNVDEDIKIEEQNIDVSSTSQSLAKGLINNIYAFKSKEEMTKHQEQALEKVIHLKKQDWINENNQKWLRNTPFIYNYHKEHDKTLHAVKTNQTFVQVKRVNNNLPQLKDFVTPFLTEAIREEMYPESQIPELQQSSRQSDNAQSPKEKSLNSLKFQQYNEMNKAQKQKLISQYQNNLAPINSNYNSDKQLTSQILNKNPNLGRIVQKLEQKHLQIDQQQPAIQAQKNRLKKLKKPLNSLAARQERIEMVKGLVMPPKDNYVTNKQFLNQKDQNKIVIKQETQASSLSHQEIEQYVKRFNMASWQQVFSLDAEFWSLIKMEQEDQAKEEDRLQKLRTGGKDSADFLDFAKQNEDEQEENQLNQGQNKNGLEVDGRSISLKTFLAYTISLSDKFKDVNLRLIQSFGVDTSNENVRIEWDQFLNMKCFLEQFTLPKDELENIWLKAIDPKGLGSVHKDDFYNFMERIARGSMSQEPTEVSKEFTRLLMDLMRMEQIIPEKQDYLNVHKLKSKMKEEKAIDVEIFNQLLRQDCLYAVWSKNHKFD